MRVIACHSISTSADYSHRMHPHAYCIHPYFFVLTIAHIPIHPCSDLPKFNMELKKSTELMTSSKLNFLGFHMFQWFLADFFKSLVEIFSTPGHWETSTLEIGQPLKAPPSPVKGLKRPQTVGFSGVHQS